MLVHLLDAFVGVGRALVPRVHIRFVCYFERFVQVVLDGGHGSADGRAPKAMGDQAEVSQAALDARV